MTAIKIFQKLYYGQCSGRVAFRKLHDLCGSRISYLCIDSEQTKVLNDVKSKVFDRFNILYSDLPDLRADGKTFFAYSTDQNEALKCAINMYSSERLDKLEELKNKFNVNSEQFIDFKKELSEMMPAIHFVAAEDYALTRFKSDGKTLTEEYKALSASTKDEIQKLDIPEPETPLEDRVIQYADARKKVEYESLIKEGKAKRLQVAELKTEYVPIAGKDTPFYHAKISDTEYAIL